MSRAAFEARFPDEASCARHLAAKRWPIRLPRLRPCQTEASPGELNVRPASAGNHAPQPLAPEDWFMAVHIVTSHSNGISALQLQERVRHGKSLLRTSMIFKKTRRGGQGRSPQGKIFELSSHRLAPIGDFSARSLHAFVAGTSAPGARVITDGWSGAACPNEPEGRRCNARPSVPKPEGWALGTCAAPICAAISRNDTATAFDRHRQDYRDIHRQIHTPAFCPIVPALQPEALETNFPKVQKHIARQKNRAGNVRPINIWCESKGRSPSYSLLKRYETLLREKRRLKMRLVRNVRHGKRSSRSSTRGFLSRLN